MMLMLAFVDDIGAAALLTRKPHMLVPPANDQSAAFLLALANGHPVKSP
jgi:hypothetical protein